MTIQPRREILPDVPPRTLSWASFFLLAAVATSSAFAQVKSDDERAQQHFLAGSSYFDQAQYEDALREFKQAYRLSKRPPLLLNIALVEERLQHFAEAADAIDEYLGLTPDTPDRVTLETRRDTFRNKAEDAAAKTEEAQGEEGPAEDSEDAAKVGRDSPLGRDRTREGGLTGAGVAGVVTLSLGVAVGVAALGTGLKANGLYGDLSDACPDGLCDPARSDDIAKGDTLARTSTALTALALAAGVTGLVLILLGRESGEETSPSVGAEVGPGYAGVSSEVRF